MVFDGEGNAANIAVKGGHETSPKVDAIYEHGRNLSDDELLAIKANGGVVQCVAFRSYVKDDGGRRDFIRKTREELEPYVAASESIFS